MFESLAIATKDIPKTVIDRAYGAGISLRYFQMVIFCFDVER